MLNFAQTVMERCDKLAAHSEEPEQVTRRFLSKPMHDVHRDVTAWFEKAGMLVRIDAVGNIVGRRSAESGHSAKTLLLGSHLDTVPNAGKYDGILGVLVSLAVIEALKGVGLPFHIDVVGFSEEEGVRYSQPYLGSRALAGTFDNTWLDRRDENGITLRQAISNFGLDANAIPDGAVTASSILGYIEVHIEQGPTLQRKNLPVGVVDAIVGQSRLVLQFIGKAGHAGTTPMIPRQDALVGAARWIQEVQRVGKQTDGLRATVGRLLVTPNATNVIPSVVELSLDVRHVTDSVRIDSIENLLAIGDRIAKDDGLNLQLIHRSDTNTTFASADLVELLSQAIVEYHVELFKMQSGAGHDAVVMGERFPMAMLFVRHPEGISHQPDERVDVGDVSVAIEVLTNFVRKLAERENHS